MDEMIESSRDFSRWFGDDLNGVDEIKLWDLFQNRDQVFREKQEKVLGVQKRTTMIGGWNSFWEMLLEWSVTILLYVLGGWLICTGGLTIGAVFAFVSYSGYVTGPVSALINLKMYFARIFPSARPSTVRAGWAAKQPSTGRSRSSAPSPACSRASRERASAWEKPQARVRRRAHMAPPQPRACPISWQRVRT